MGKYNIAIYYLVNVLGEPNKRSQIINQILVLELDISILRKKLDEQNNMAKEHIEMRNRFNERRRSKLNEVQTLKEKRDHFNDFVKDQKTLLIEKRKDVRKKQSGIQQHKQVIKETLLSVKMLKNEAQSRINDLDWKIQTNPTSREEEKKIVYEIKELQIVIEKYKKIESNEKEIQRLYTEIDVQRKEIAIIGDRIKSAVNGSQNHHKEMIQKFQESNELKNHIDNAHKANLEVKKKANDIYKSLINKRDMLSRLEYELENLNSIDNEVKTEKEEEMVNNIVTEAQRKIKDGEKVTFNEFKLLLERDLFKSSKKK